MKRHTGQLALALLITTVIAEAGEPLPTTRETYLALAKAAYEQSAAPCREQVAKWMREYEPNDTYGYTPPGTPPWLAGLAGALYDLTGDEAYAEEAVKWLSEQHLYKQYYPEELRKKRPEYNDFLPPLTDFFHLSPFASAYMYVRNSPAVTAEKRALIEQNIAEAADFVFNFPEWGPMNRAMLRAEGLAFAARALPEHPHAAHWRKLAAVLASDSWGHWEEEDASIYHPVWLYALLRYGDAVEDHSLYQQTTTRFYFEYFLHLMAPYGTIPDFGDGRWKGSWPSYLVCLERGAAEYHRPEFKWAAQRILQTMGGEEIRPLGVRTGLIFADACHWVDDELAPQIPTTGSEEVLEDLVGKKIVFRDGWQPDSTYLLLNYRDQGDFARTPRDYLRNTIPVEEEKMHHGHSDENSICLLMHNGTVLLHDGGYRDRMPSGDYGAYRADYFHNRLVGRQDKHGRKQPLIEFLRHTGAYHPVRTEKIDFFTFDEVDMSRTRLHDERTGFVSDRVVAYLKPDDVFVVFDIVKTLRPDYFTFATLWHATNLLEQGEHYFVTGVDAIRTESLPTDEALLIAFLQHGTRTEGTFPIQRHQQDEETVYQAMASHYQAGQIQTFVTVLVPHKRGTDVAPILQQLRLLDVDQPQAGVGVELTIGGKTRLLCVKTDLEKDILPENVRPRYTFESGRVQYGPISTDASFVYARPDGKTLTYVAANMVKVLYNDQTLFAARTSTYSLQPDDLSTGYGPPKWRYWEDTVELR